MDDFATRLFDILQEREYKQLWVAKMVGTDPKRVNDWVHGKCLPDLWHFKKLCKVLGVSADYLLFGKDKVNDEI